jgi:hypothetical protein
MKLLQQIASACETCQKLRPKPIRFKASLPKMEDIVFGDELSIDLMFIDGQAVLHVVDTATRFSSATFLDSHNGSFGHSVEGIWLAFIETWFTLYTGYPNRLRIDAGSIFASPRWKELSNMAGITLRMSGVEAHNSPASSGKECTDHYAGYMTRFEWIGLPTHSGWNPPETRREGHE